MKQKYTRWLAVAAMALAGSGALPHRSAMAIDPVSVAPAASPAEEMISAPSNEQVASVEALKTEAFQALRRGHFETGNELLGQAAVASKDPQVARMHEWTNQFEDQMKVFASERHAAFDKTVADVKMLLDKGHSDYALDFARGAQLLSDDKKAFHDEPWVLSLINDSIEKAKGYEASEQWLKALRIYSDLASLEPASKEWKEDLKGVTRRVRLLALYTPDTLKEIQEKESKERDEVDGADSVQQENDHQDNHRELA